MAGDPVCLFWDSCVFYAYLKDETATYDVASIVQYLDEAKRGLVRIYTSTLALSEIVPSAIKKPEIGSFLDFLTDYQGSIVLIEANPNIMHAAAVLKDLPYRKGQSTKRRLTTIDAIMLASCLYQRDTVGVPIAEFHTFDDGGAKGIEGKAVPLLSYQEWCEGFDANQRKSIGGVIELRRRRPIHPRPAFDLSTPPQTAIPAPGASAAEVETPAPLVQVDVAAKGAADASHDHAVPKKEAEREEAPTPPAPISTPPGQPTSPVPHNN